MDFAKTFTDHAYCINAERNGNPILAASGDQETITAAPTVTPADDTDGGEQPETDTETDGEGDAESQSPRGGTDTSPQSRPSRLACKIKDCQKCQLQL